MLAYIEIPMRTTGADKLAGSSGSDGVGIALSDVNPKQEKARRGGLFHWSVTALNGNHIDLGFGRGLAEFGDLIEA